MLDSHDAILLEELVWVVVYQLSVNENVAPMLADFFDFGFHLLLFCLFNLSNGLEGVHLHTGSIDLDLVCVHLAVCNQDLAILESLWLSNTNLLLKDKPLLQERVLQRGACLLDNLDVVEIRLPPQ